MRHGESGGANLSRSRLTDALARDACGLRNTHQEDVNVAGPCTEAKSGASVGVRGEARFLAQGMEWENAGSYLIRGSCAHKHVPVRFVVGVGLPLNSLLYLASSFGS